MDADHRPSGGAPPSCCLRTSTSDGAPDRKTPKGGRSRHAQKIPDVGSGFRLFFLPSFGAKAAFHRAPEGHRAVQPQSRKAGADIGVGCSNGLPSTPNAPANFSAATACRPRDSPKPPCPPMPVEDRSHVNLIQVTCRPGAPVPTSSQTPMPLGQCWSGIDQGPTPSRRPAGPQGPEVHCPCPLQKHRWPWVDAG